MTTDTNDFTYQGALHTRLRRDRIRDLAAALFVRVVTRSDINYLYELDGDGPHRTISLRDRVDDCLKAATIFHDQIDKRESTEDE